MSVLVLLTALNLYLAYISLIWLPLLGCRRVSCKPLSTINGRWTEYESGRSLAAAAGQLAEVSLTTAAVTGLSSPSTQTKNRGARLSVKQNTNSYQTTITRLLTNLP